MSQQLFYGGYAFDPDAVWFTIHKQAIIGRLGRRKYIAEMWHLTGRVSGANSEEVQAKVVALENAMTDGGDLVFTLTHALYSADCVEGTHVYSLKWLPGFDGTPRGSGAEMVLRRTFQITIGGKKLATGIDTDLIEYRETIRGRGTGGPIVLPVTALAGDVQAQQRVLKTPFWTTQSGYAVGLTEYPLPATRLWLLTPNVYYMPDQVSGGYTTPENFGINQNTGFRTDWNYLCWSNFQLVGSPVLPF